MTKEITSREKPAADREKSAADREKGAAEREKALADLELQIELAVIARGSSRNSRVDNVKNWLLGSNHSTVVSELNQECDWETGHKESIGDVRQLSMSVLHPSPLDDASTKSEAIAVSFPSVRGSRRCDAKDFAMIQPTTLRTPELGTQFLWLWLS